MVKLHAPVSDETIRRLRGVIDFSCWKGIFYARTWPRNTGRAQTPASLEAARLFGEISKEISFVPEQERDVLRSETADGGFTWKDLLTWSLSGALKPPLG